MPDETQRKSIMTLFVRFLKSATKMQVSLGFLLLIFLVLVVLLTVKGSRPEYNFSSRFLDAVDVAELSTSELIYNGIVDVYDSDAKKILYTMSYNSTLKVGIQMTEIKFEFDDKQKTVKPILPPITLQPPVVDPASIDFIPQNPNVDFKVAIAACKEDALQEAEKSEKLIQIAEENLETVVEALIRPLAEEIAYRVTW